MNYLISTLIALVLILFLYAKAYTMIIKQLKRIINLLLVAYETSIRNLEENKAKFEKEILIKKSL